MNWSKRNATRKKKKRKGLSRGRRNRRRKTRSRQQGWRVIASLNSKSQRKKQRSEEPMQVCVRFAPNL
jgi:hypothetical protein